MASKIATDVFNGLTNVFPNEIITPEYYIRYKGNRLFFDYYIRGLGVLIECQGEQHYKFVKHFHGTVDNFRRAKKRDNLKIEFAEENNLTLVFFYDKLDKIDEALILKRIHEAQLNG